MRGALLAMLALGACARGGSVSDDEGPASGADAAVADASPDAALPDSPPADACVPTTTQLLANPALDLTPMGTGWVQQPISSSAPLITAQDGVGEHSPPYKAWLGGINASSGNTVTDVLHQEVAIPAMTSQLVLTGFYQVRTSDSQSTVYDTASVALIQTTGTPIETVLALSNLTTKSEWTAFAHTFTQNVSGQTVRLRFTSSSDEGAATHFFFDTLALTATHCGP